MTALGSSEPAVYDDPLPAIGVIPVDGRGSLPFALLRGEPLVALAAWALGEAGVELADFDAGWDELRAGGRPLILHDPLCPLTPPAFLASCVAEAVATGQPVAGFRPVTDTVKLLDGDRIGGTVDRDGLRQVLSPVVLPAAVLDGLDQAPDDDDFATLCRTLGRRYPIRWREAPGQARRIGDPAQLVVLEELAGLSAG